MFGYIVRRLLGAIPTLLIIIVATFLLMRLAPGGPFDGERRLPPEIERNIKAAYNLDKSVFAQLFHSYWNTCQYRFSLMGVSDITVAGETPETQAKLQNYFAQQRQGMSKVYGAAADAIDATGAPTNIYRDKVDAVLNAPDPATVPLSTLRGEARTAVLTDRLPAEMKASGYRVGAKDEVFNGEGRAERCLGGYLGGLMQGDFGPSFKNKDFTVSELIALGAPVSMKLGLSAIMVAVFIGSFLGIIAALNQNTAGDYSVMSLAMIGITIPTFVTAPFLTLMLGVYAGIFPVAGYNDGAFENMVLPVTVLALPQIAIIARLVRGSMVEVLRSNFVRTARAKGLTEGQVVWRHVLRAGLLPLVSYLGPAIAGLVTGSLVVEQIFGLPGIGRYFVQGALNRDYTLVMGVVILFATLIILLNLVADVMYRVLDPKVKLG